MVTLGFGLATGLAGTLNAAGAAIIIDHNCLDLSKIPDGWIGDAQKQIKLHYAHTSHGGQLTTGLQIIKSSDPKYDFSLRNSALPNTEGVLCIFDGQESKTTGRDEPHLYLYCA